VFERKRHQRHLVRARSVGCLHVRPILNLRLDKDVKAMRAIAEQAFSFVREYKGSHSGEHGDGIVRSEFHEFMFGQRLVRASRGEGPLRSGRPLQSGQDRARAEVRRPFELPLRAGLCGRADDRAARLVLPIRGRAAVSRARSRCATTTAPAVRSPAA
jgi:hypothetical protein